MAVAKTTTHIAYRCPDCGMATLGIVGKFALKANMVRLKCECDNFSLDIKMTNDGKVRLSVPCIFCRQNHNYVISQTIFFERDIFMLNCPYSNMDICFTGEKEKIDNELERTGAELTRLLADLEVEEVRDIQPMDVDESEVLPDPAVYDTVRFLVKDLEEEHKIDCACHRGTYELRFTDTGIQVYCPDCGAVFDFNTSSASLIEEYLALDEIRLK